MSAPDRAFPRLAQEEGFRSRLYADTRGYQTLGYGFNVSAGITQRAAAALLRAQLEELHEALCAYSWYENLDEARQAVCLDIAFNDGLHGLVLGFPKMIAALSTQNWTVAASECHVTNPELASRYDALAKILLTGASA